MAKRKISREALLERMRPTLEPRDKNLVDNVTPDLDPSKWDALSGYSADEVRQLPNPELEYLGRKLGILEPDEELG